MASRSPIETIRELLRECTLEEEALLFRELRARHRIHEFEHVIGAPAEMILEAVHRAPELTRRMLRGVIADAAFRTLVVPSLEPTWRDVTPEGNFAYDYKLEDGTSKVTVQVKLQRSARGVPVVKAGRLFGFADEVFMTETQRTRSGTDGSDNQTRPYRYDDFDILAVSMQPLTGRWDRYMYTLGRWLLPGKRGGEMATLQPVSKIADDWWTDDFRMAAQWLRADDAGKRMALAAKASVRRKAGKIPR